MDLVFLISKEQINTHRISCCSAKWNVATVFKCIYQLYSNTKVLSFLLQQNCITYTFQISINLQSQCDWNKNTPFYCVWTSAENRVSWFLLCLLMNWLFIYHKFNAHQYDNWKWDKIHSKCFVCQPLLQLSFCLLFQIFVCLHFICVGRTLSFIAHYCFITVYFNITVSPFHSFYHLVLSDYMFRIDLLWTVGSN